MRLHHHIYMHYNLWDRSYPHPKVGKSRGLMGLNWFQKSIKLSQFFCDECSIISFVATVRIEPFCHRCSSFLAPRQRMETWSEEGSALPTSVSSMPVHGEKGKVLGRANFPLQLESRWETLFLAAPPVSTSSSFSVRLDRPLFQNRIEPKA